MEQKFSKHYANDRQKRETLIQVLIGEGEAVETFKEVCKDGRIAYHTITTTGIIIIKDESDVIITKKIARPNQIKKYFNVITEQIQAVLDMAMLHTKCGYNTIQLKKTLDKITA